MRLCELFDSVYSYAQSNKSERRRETVVKFEFYTDTNSKVEVWLERDYSNPDRIEVSFTRNGSVGLTNEGDAIKILSTVMHIIEHEITNHFPNYKQIYFSSYKDDESESRKFLYKRIAQQMANKHNMELSVTEDNRKTAFVLDKK